MQQHSDAKLPHLSSFMETFLITASDNVPIAYDVTGNGPAIILLHGSGNNHSRKSWHQAGYVARLATRYKVIAIDIRGEMGDSGKPTDSAAYTIERMCQDVLEVADACGVEQFILWGFSYGGNIGRFLATRSPRVTKFVMIGIPFGPAVQGRFGQFIEYFIVHWPPILEAQRHGTLDWDALSAEDREDLEAEDMNAPLAWFTAMLDWGSIEPQQLPCPTLWVSGTENPGTMASITHYKDALVQSNVQTHIIEGINHQQEFNEIDRVFPILFAFTKK